MAAGKRIIMGLVLFQTLVLFLPATKANQKAQQVRHYIEQKGAETHQILWSLLNNNGFDLTYKKETTTHLTHTDEDFATLTWVMKDTAHHTDLTAKRKENSIVITGRFKGQAIDKHISVDEAPWFQATSLSLQNFATSHQKSIKFWTLRTDNLKAYKLRASKNGYEELPFNGAPCKMVKVRLNLSGWLAPFWKSFYWFKADDGLFFRFEGPGDPYGNVQIIINYENDLVQ